jgi:DNA-binding winged helix-turn-helix (wHTH) protein
MSAVANARLYRFGIYEADTRSGELRKNGARLKLQDQPFQVLAMLLERPGEVVTREQLRQRLWPADTFVDFDHSLNTAINKLRDTLGDQAANPRFIETLAKRGYRFIAPVQATVAQNETSQTSGGPPLRPGLAQGGEIPHPIKQDNPLAPPLSRPGLARQGGDFPAPTQLPEAPPTADQCAVAVARAESPAARDDHALPKISRSLGRTLFALLQVMYLCFYIVALARWRDVGRVADGAIPGWDWLILVVVIISSVIGIPTRLYLLTAVLFDFRRLGENFRRIFPALFLLDELWALAPFLAMEDIGFGLAFAATAALLYVPFSQRSLVRMTYSTVSD